MHPTKVISRYEQTMHNSPWLAPWNPSSTDDDCFLYPAPPTSLFLLHSNINDTGKEDWGGQFSRMGNEIIARISQWSGWWVWSCLKSASHALHFIPPQPPQPSDRNSCTKVNGYGGGQYTRKEKKKTRQMYSLQVTLDKRLVVCKLPGVAVAWMRHQIVIPGMWDHFQWNSIFFIHSPRVGTLSYTLSLSIPQTLLIMIEIYA